MQKFKDSAKGSAVHVADTTTSSASLTKDEFIGVALLRDTELSFVKTCGLLMK